jgi:hypothetical protein
MTEGHSDIGPELRQLAQMILDKLDPAVRLAAARAMGNSQGKCQQVWCPVCALAEYVTGEEHPLLSVVAEHSVALLEVIRAVVGETGDRPGPPDGPPPDGAGGAPAKTGYEHIPVTIEH